MRWRRTTQKRLEMADSPCLGNLVNDILGLILEYVCDEDLGGLLQLCLVSRRMYISTIPYLYRTLELNFARASHMRLVQRLVRPGSRLPEKIRNLAITATEKESAIQLLDLYVLMTRLVYLRQFDWNGCLNIPHLILETLANQFPKTCFTVEASQVKLGIAANNPSSLFSVLNHRAGWQLTKFDFEPDDMWFVYRGFKKDLVRMLRHNRTMKSLRIHEDLDDGRDWPEMLRLFQTGKFPPLMELLLTTRLFSHRELACWAKRGGWDNLIFLKIHDPQHLCEFIGKASKLQELLFFSTDTFDIDQVAAHLESDPVPAPFGSVRRLSYKDSNNWLSDAQDKRVIPWCMLEKLPELKELDIHRSRFDYIVPGPCLDTATAEDIRKARQLCPGLQRFQLDVALGGVTATWPLDVVLELARFTEPIEINLYLHLIDRPWTRATIHRLTCRKIFKLMLKERIRLGLPCYQPFQVGFKVVRLYEKIQEHWNITDYDVYLDLSGKIRLDRYWHEAAKQSLDEMSVEELQAGRTKERIAKRIGWDRRGYEGEMRRREVALEEEDLEVEGSVSLYDVWA